MKQSASLKSILLASPLVLAIAGCSSTPPSKVTCGLPCDGSPTPAVTHIYVVENVPQGATGQPTILQFPASASGSVAPENTITLSAGLTLGAITESNGNIYVATSADVREYAPGATGAATPTRLIPANATTTIGAVTGLAVDASGNIYISEQGAGIAVFDATANGSVAPTRYILGNSQPGGGLSTIQIPGALTTDASGNLYVANQDSIGGVGSVLVFGPGATGNVAPLRTIAGALTTLNTAPHGIATDLAGNLYVADNNLTPNNSVLVFAAGASGNVAPTRAITGSSTQLGVLYGLSVDASNNIFVVTEGYPLNNVLPGNPTILSFAATATGNVAPSSSFTSPQWTVDLNALTLAAD